MKIKAKPEGRDGIWVADKKSLVDFLMQYEYEQIHNFIPKGGMIIGADWSKESVIEAVKDSERLAILTGDSYRHNMGHALSVIKNNELRMFDIGEITDSDIKAE